MKNSFFLLALASATFFTAFESEPKTVYFYFVMHGEENTAMKNLVHQIRRSDEKEWIILEEGMILDKVPEDTIRNFGDYKLHSYQERVRDPKKIQELDIYFQAQKKILAARVAGLGFNNFELQNDYESCVFPKPIRRSDFDKNYLVDLDGETKKRMREFVIEDRKIDREFFEKIEQSKEKNIIVLIGGAHTQIARDCEKAGFKTVCMTMPNKIFWLTEYNLDLFD